MIKLRAYLASGWFNKDQVKVLKQMENVLALLDYVDVYSPRKESVYKPSEGNHADIVKENLKALHNVDVVVASTEGKDMGTLFECGYATAIGVPVIYYYPQYGDFNIMLAATGKVVRTAEELITTMYEFRDTRTVTVNNYTGGML